MLVSVSQRTAEIGLLKALGATRGQLLRWFLCEAALLSLAGALCGSLLGRIGIEALQWWFPNFPVALPAWAMLAALAVALATGLVFGVMPARRAAALEPVAALNRR
ncbi:ABC transporter permease [Methylomonas koyamae]|nr:FtsX-like permease family protein [Methylomonas koyamae]